MRPHKPSSLACLGFVKLTLLVLLIPHPTWPQDETANDVQKQIDSHLAAARKAETVKDYTTAANEYEKIIDLRPDWALIHQSLGVTYHLSGRYPQAIQRFQEALRLDDQLWGSLLFLGMDYYQTHEFGLAIKALEKSLAMNPKMGGPEAKRWLGLSHAALQQYEPALHYLLSVAEIKPDDIEVLFHLSRVYDGRATQLFERIGEFDPDSPFVHLLQAERFASESNSERARLEYARAMELRPDLSPSGGPEPPNDQFEKVRSDFAAGRFEAAAMNAKQRLSLQPANAEAMYWLGSSYKRLAASTLARLMEVDPESYRVDQLSAEQYEQKTEYDRALTSYQKALEKRPRLPGLRYAIGNVYWKLRRYEEAEKWLSEELENNPYHTLAHYRLGALYVDLGKAGDAIPHLQRALAANPELLGARLDLGRAFLTAQQYEFAAEEFETYSRADPGNDRVHYLLANAYRGLGRIEDAQRELSLYQQLNRERLRRVQVDVKSVSEELKAGPQ